ncbi:hypothetical protein T12_10267 [Trichinella patagoniensis]|uniref:Uncharacterized protein n=1 Tax=Trichinella patagoniensis TaxID=990121 RepID=A0A0V0ZC78_9BILA|nr:hypothetical protein T12_10267 [Trichinella patagoniensis]
MISSSAHCSARNQTDPHEMLQKRAKCEIKHPHQLQQTVRIRKHEHKKCENVQERCITSRFRFKQCLYTLKMRKAQIPIL